MESKCFKLKALVDKKKNRVILAECDNHFLDSFFEFLRMPMGEIMNQNRNQPREITIGCINNLYASVENLDVSSFRTEACKNMLLHAFKSCEELYYYCGSWECICKYKLFSYFRGAICNCGKPMETLLFSHTRNAWNYVKSQTRLMITDKLQMVPPSSAISFSLLSELGVSDLNTIEERTIDIGVNEVLALLTSSLVSNTPLTDNFLNRHELPESSKRTRYQISCSFLQQEIGEKGDGKIRLILVLSKSKKTVYYAEAGEDFVNLLFSFLSIPLAYIAKEMKVVEFSKGRLNHLYESVKNLEVEKYFVTNEDKEFIVSPSIETGYKYENQLLDLEEVVDDNEYYILRNDSTRRKMYIGEPRKSTSAIAVKPNDPKSEPYEEGESRGSGFVKGPAMFTVTDDLIVTPISFVSVVSNLKKLKVPLSDIEQRVAYVGKEEALRLLMASCFSKSALTDTFLYKKPKKERS